MSLYLKYRPLKFEEVIGNEGVISVLQTMLKKKNPPHSFLFTGETGCGKTTLARILANGLGCIGDDLKEVDTADFRGIDTIREIRNNCKFKPVYGSCRVWILDECHKLGNDAQNALLKLLEDTPSHVYLILCTTDPQKLIPTIKGRCSIFQVNRLEDVLMMRLLRRIVKAENEQLTKEVYEQIVQDGLGHPRNALNILEQVLNTTSDKRLQVAKKSAELQSDVIALCRALLGNLAWKKVADILRELTDQDPENIRRAVLGYCQTVLLKGDNTKAGLILECFIEPFYNTGFPGLVYACYSVVKN